MTEFTFVDVLLVLGALLATAIVARILLPLLLPQANPLVRRILVWAGFFAVAHLVLDLNWGVIFASLFFLEVALFVVPGGGAK